MEQVVGAPVTHQLTLNALSSSNRTTSTQKKVTSAFLPIEGKSVAHKEDPAHLTPLFFFVRKQPAYEKEKKATRIFSLKKKQQNVKNKKKIRLTIP
jgi:hypothetical protein